LGCGCEALWNWIQVLIHCVTFEIASVKNTSGKPPNQPFLENPPTNIDRSLISPSSYQDFVPVSMR
jgi:hypothetical protein